MEEEVVSRVERSVVIGDEADPLLSGSGCGFGVEEQEGVMVRGLWRERDRVGGGKRRRRVEAMN